jgi:hypothetical protein
MLTDYPFKPKFSIFALCFKVSPKGGYLQPEAIELCARCQDGRVRAKAGGRRDAGAARTSPAATFPLGQHPIRQVRRDTPPWRGLDQVRKKQYTRLRGRDRSQKYTLLSRRDNLTWTGAVPLHKLLQTNQRLNAGYLVKEPSGSCRTTGARLGRGASSRIGKASLRWQRLEPRPKFAAIIDRHTGMASPPIS